MITPYFSLLQNDEFLILSVKCPCIRAQDIEYTIDSHVFYFYARPYYLRLSFEGALVQNGQEKVTLDMDAGTLTFQLPKLEKGTPFPNLDLLTGLLQTPPKKPKVLIEQELDQDQGQVDEHEENMENSQSDNNVTHDDENDDSFWTRQACPEPSSSLPSLNQVCYYGFNSAYSGIFKDYPIDQLMDMIHLPEPETTLATSRPELQSLAEELAFNEERYMLDYLDEDGSIARLIEMTWSFDKEVSFSEQDKNLMIALKPKSWILHDVKKIYFGCLDILLAICYNQRLTERENTVESTWTIATLSASLCWLREFDSLESVLSSFFKRSLTFPLYRHVGFSMAVLKDAVAMLKAGKRALLKAFLELKYMLDHDEFKYILSKIFIDDYCVWIQSPHASTQLLLSMAEHLDTMLQNSPSAIVAVPWPLAELEQRALALSAEDGSEACDVDEGAETPVLDMA